MASQALAISDALYAELTATCDSLGYNDGKKFHLDKNSIEVIKDLIRYLRRDDDTHAVRRFLGQSKVLQKDLIPIFVEHSDKEELWNVLLRLLINLTSPALMVYNEELPTEKITRSYYLQLLSQLQNYKSAMANDAVWAIVHEKLKNILAIESSERGEDNETSIDRILILIRNVLRVPASDNEKRTDNDTTVHDEVLFALHSSGISDLLVYIASTAVEQQYHMQILEIIAFMLQGQNPAKLAKVEMQRSNLEKQQDEAKLMIIRQKEQAEKMAKMKKYAGSRHSKFGGTFVVENMKAIGNNEMICHKPYQKIEDLDFSITKQKSKKRKNKNGIMDMGEERVSALSVRLFLKEFCVEFLNGAYNPVMRHARSCIQGNAGANAADASHYLWALRFFMNFNRHYNFRVKYVSETISTEVFYIVQRQIEHNYEMIMTDKKKVAFWSTRMHLGIKAYQELLFTLIEMDKSNDQGVKKSSRVIMGNIFYVPEYRDTILSQLLNYNELTMSRDYLVDLIATAHIFLKMLKNFCDKERHIVVQKVKRKKPKKKTKSSTAASQSTAAESSRSLEDRWDEVGPEVSAVMQQNAIPEVRPFDATIDTPIDDQKGDAMKRIQKLLRSKDYEQAIGLLRSARDVWPENDSFGRANMPPEEEFLVLREIFFAELGVPENEPVDNSQNARKSSGNQIESLLNHDDEEDDDDEEEDEESEQPRFEESSFKFMDFLQRFANVRVVSNLTVLLKQFDRNTPELNHYVLKMLHRIAFECKMPAMIYQASIFRVFQRIFQSDNRALKDLAAFGRYIFRSFAEVAQRNPKAYMELLFWKSTKQAVEMTDGYDTEPKTNKKVSRNAWSEVEEDELRTLFMEHQTNKYPQDLIEFIQANLINQDRTSRGIIKKLKEMCLIVNSKRVRNDIQKRLPKEWSEEEIAQLTEIWENVKEDDDPIGVIYDSLRIKRSKPKIKEKLLELHLADDPKQLRKKRAKKSGGRKKADSEQNEDGHDSNVEEDENSPQDESNESGSENDSDDDLPTVKSQATFNQVRAALESRPDSSDSEEEQEKTSQKESNGNDANNISENHVSLDKSSQLKRMEEDPDSQEEKMDTLNPAETDGSSKSNSKKGDGKSSRIRKVLDSDSEEEVEKASQNADITQENKTTSKKIKAVLDSSDSDEEPEKSLNKEDSKKGKSNKSAKMLDSDSEEEKMDTHDVVKTGELKQQSESNFEEKRMKSSRIRKVVDSDSEEEVEKVSQNDDEISLESKRIRTENSDAESTPVQKKRRVLDSDEEDNFMPENEKATEKKQARVLSDDED